MLEETKSPWVPVAKPTEADIGRRVAYTGNRYPGGVWEYGTIQSFNDATVFVLYEGKKRNEATSPADLMWITP
jgi:hypothetical protein